MPRTLMNRTGPPDATVALAGAVCLTVGIALVVARFARPTPVIVSVAAVLIVAGFSLLINGALALFSRPVWTEGTILDRRWTVRGARRVGVIVLDTGAVEPLAVPLKGAVFTALTVGDRVRVEHGSLDRLRVFRVELLDSAGPAAS